MTATRIDPLIQTPEAASGHARLYPAVLDALIDAVNDHADDLDEVEVSSDAPLTTIVFRPGFVSDDTNVYGTWAEAYAAVLSVAGRGKVNLEFDARFSPTVEPSTGLKSCVVPIGVWNMTNVTWTQAATDMTPNPGRTFVELADGASIVMTAPVRTLRIVGDNLVVFSNRVGPIAPFDDVDLILGGSRTQLRNTLLVPGALPAFKVGASGAGRIVIEGSNNQGGVSGGALSGNPPAVSPVVDMAGGFLSVVGGAGQFNDNALTDSVGGGFAQFEIKDDNFNGRPFAAEGFSFPALAPGSFVTFASGKPRRYVEDLGGAFLTPVTFPLWDAFFNELVPCDPAGGGVAGITVNAPSATGTWGEQFTACDAAGTATALDTILILPLGGETLAGPAGSDSITTAFGSRTYVSNGYGVWMLTASV